MIWMTSKRSRLVSARSRDKLTDYLYQILLERIIKPRRECLGQSQKFTTAKCIGTSEKKKNRVENSQLIQVCIFSALPLKYLPNVYRDKY